MAESKLRDLSVDFAVKMIKLCKKQDTSQEFLSSDVSDFYL